MIRVTAQHLRHARNIARRFCRSGPHAEDFEGAAYEGVARAARTFAPQKGVTFSAYMAWKVSGALRDEARRQDHLSRRHRWAVKAGEASAPVLVPLSEWSEVDRETPEDRLLAAERAAQVRRAIEALPERERRLVQWLYWDGLTQEEAGRRMGVSLTRVGQLAQRARSRVRGRIGPDWTGADRIGTERQ